MIDTQHHHNEHEEGDALIARETIIFLGMFMSDRRWSSSCTLSGGQRNNNKKLENRSSPHASRTICRTVHGLVRRNYPLYNIPQVVLYQVTINSLHFSCVDPIRNHLLRLQGRLELIIIRAVYAHYHYYWTTHTYPHEKRGAVPVYIPHGRCSDPSPIR